MEDDGGSRVLRMPQETRIRDEFEPGGFDLRP